MGGVREDCHPMDFGGDFLEQLQLLAKGFRSNAVVQPCDISARARETLDEPEPNRIKKISRNDGNGSGSVLGCQGRRYDDVHLEANQPGSKVGQPIRPARSKARVDGNVLPFNPPELTQPLSEGLMEMWVTRCRGVRKITYPEWPLRVLRLAGNRRGKQAPDRRAAEKPDGISPPHATPPRFT